MINETLEFHCPWCGETNAVEAEPGDAGQWIIQDCRVCCSPIEILFRRDSNDAIEVARG